MPATSHAVATVGVVVAAVVVCGGGGWRRRGRTRTSARKPCRRIGCSRRRARSHGSIATGRRSSLRASSLSPKTTTKLDHSEIRIFVPLMKCDFVVKNNKNVKK